MSGEIEGAAGLVTGGLVARTLDSHGFRAGDTVSSCPNCGAAITGNYCANCGQSAHVERSLGHIVEEVLHGVLHFDGKAWRTLPMLAFRPGRLTRDYIDGRRVRYIAPLALFLFSVFLMYFAFALVGGPAVGVRGEAVDQAAIADARASLADERARLAEARAALKAGGSPAVMEARRRGIARGEAALAVVDKAIAARAANRSYDWKDELAASAREKNLIDIEGAPKLEARINRALRNPDLLIYKVQQVAYKLSFLLVPLSLPFVWLLFAFRRGVHLYDHSVFVLYSMAFMTLFFVLLALAARIGAGDNIIGTAAVLVPPVHMFAQLKGTYRLGNGGALWRTAALLAMAGVVLALFLLIVLALGALD